MTDFDNVELDLLLLKARAAEELLTEDHRLHMHHEQRISFASGNVLLSMRDLTVEQKQVIRDGVRRAAGDCPCVDCVNKRTLV